mmetsp:Transcript_7865/g.12173  ORF Transcript_7865/g.12173 Transcript_7865/m.12173 type:complete len:120 (+) Transcript_7865:2794-3153(+)|eukprot:CAMPEP_0170484244 /NCGR_PEP_ID=MMETSP0208-20121228/3741_1 /TAXON_ID=197538 /ORGANISM="Strombidium inclinatum, Strain S3" /LENGTH=119 /DNA_ID=CAMNT_0010757525 /DNA_START=2745 /DNA_END=3104 /DNA_ORIENTATION=-
MNKLREMPDPAFVNFIGRCLEWDPKKRLTPDEGLQHEWIIKGLPPNIILHNPHNNPYARTNHNSSNSTKTGSKHLPSGRRPTKDSTSRTDHNSNSVRPRQQNAAAQLSSETMTEAATDK